MSRNDIICVAKFHRKVQVGYRPIYSFKGSDGRHYSGSIEVSEVLGADEIEKNKPTLIGMDFLNPEFALKAIRECKVKVGDEVSLTEDDPEFIVGSIRIKEMNLNDISVQVMKTEKKRDLLKNDKPALESKKQGPGHRTVSVSKKPKHKLIVTRKEFHEDPEAILEKLERLDKVVLVDEDGNKRAVMTSPVLEDKNE